MNNPFFVWLGDTGGRHTNASPIDLSHEGSLIEPNMTDGNSILGEMNDRSREVFRRVVEGYLDTGEPVGSRTLSRYLTENVSAATIRNVMQDLEFLGLLDSRMSRPVGYQRSKGCECLWTDCLKSAI